MQGAGRHRWPAPLFIMNDIYTRFDKYKDAFARLLEHSSNDEIEYIQSLIIDPIDGRFVVAALSSALKQKQVGKGTK